MGGKYVAIVPGAEEALIENKGEINDTQSSVSFETLLSKFLFSKQDDDKPKTSKGKTAHSPKKKEISAEENEDDLKSRHDNKDTEDDNAIKKFKNKTYSAEDDTKHLSKDDQKENKKSIPHKALRDTLEENDHKESALKTNDDVSDVKKKDHHDDVKKKKNDEIKDQKSDKKEEKHDAKKKKKVIKEKAKKKSAKKKIIKAKTVVKAVKEGTAEDDSAINKDETADSEEETDVEEEANTEEENTEEEEASNSDDKENETETGTEEEQQTGVEKDDDEKSDVNAEKDEVSEEDAASGDHTDTNKEKSKTQVISDDKKEQTVLAAPKTAPQVTKKAKKIAPAKVIVPAKVADHAKKAVDVQPNRAAQHPKKEQTVEKNPNAHVNAPKHVKPHVVAKALVSPKASLKNNAAHDHKKTATGKKINKKQNQPAKTKHDAESKNQQTKTTAKNRIA